MTQEERLSILKILRNETGCGFGLLSDSLDTLLDKLIHKPLHKMDVGHKLKMEWEEYDLRKNPPTEKTQNSN